MKTIKVTLAVEIEVQAENDDDAANKAVKIIEDGVIAAETANLAGAVEVVAP